MSKTAFMRGLQNFIQDIRSCQNKEQEEKRVQKELGKIRSKFAEDTGSMSAYDKRKYVWKLLYIHMLGYSIDFGFKQAVDLIPKPKYKDKQVGYMACSILLHEDDDFLRLAINGVHQDLLSRNEAFECLALSFIGSVGGKEMADTVVPDIVKFLSTGASRPLVKKRAALCLLRMIRKAPTDQPMVSPDTFCTIMNGLLEERDLGLLLSSVTLLCGILARSGSAGYESCQSRLIRILERLGSGKERDVPAEYLYYGIPSPWLHSKCLRALQYFGPPEVLADRALLASMLKTIIDNSFVGDGTKPNKSNAIYAIMFEGVALAVHLRADPNLLSIAASALGRFLTTKDSNIKYLTLEMLSRLTAQPDIVEAIRPHQGIVSAALKEHDVAIRKRALDLMYNLCNEDNVTDVVSELFLHMSTADFSMKEDLVLKIAILAEKHAPSVAWYVDTTMRLLEFAGDFVSDDIWQRAVELVNNNPPIQAHAASNVVQVLKRGITHESLACTAAYILGGYGGSIKMEAPPAEQFRLLNALLPTSSQTTKGLLVTALLKIYLLDPHDQSMKREISTLIERHRTALDPDLQTRAAQYVAQADQPGVDASKFFLPMPKWPEREPSQPRKWEAVQSHVATAAAAAAPPPVLEPTASVASTMHRPQPSLDLLGEEAPLAGTASDPFAVLATSSAAVPPQPPKPANTVDLLSDLFADTLIPSPAAMPPASGPSPFVPASERPSANPFLAGGFASSAAVLPAPAVFGAPAAPLQPPAMPAAPVPSANPFMAAWPAAEQPVAVPQPQPTLAVPPPHAVAAGYPPFGLPPPAMPYGAMPAQPLQPVQSFPAYSPAPVAVPHVPEVHVAHAAAALSMAGDRHAPVGAPSGVAAAAAPGFSDPFGDHAFGSPAPPPVHFEPAVVSGDLVARYNALLYKDRGILYEDQYLQVGVMATYSEGKGEFMLFLGNKNTEHSLEHVAVTATSSSSVEALVPPLPSSQVAPKQQVKVPINLTCLGPVVDVPVIHLSYVLGNVSVNQELQVPVANHRFLVPEPNIAKELFFEQWKAIGNPTTRAQEMVVRETALSSESVMSVMQQAKLGVTHGYLDPSPYNEAGAAHFMHGPLGAEQKVLVMCRVEGNPQNMAQFRVTVVSALPELSSSTKDFIVGRLRSL